MQFGVWIPTCRHLASADVIRRTATLAEDLGYASVWVSDHVVAPRPNAAQYGTIYDPLIALALVAGITRRVHLGTTVLIVPYRHAVLTAKMVASLDNLSGGRFILGVGSGWNATESAILGAPFAERGPMTDEYLRAMEELWASPEPRFDGRYNHFEDVVFNPRPAQQPRPPIWVGGHSRAALRRTVEFGDAWHPINRSVEELAAGRAQLEVLSRRLGRATPPALTTRNDVRLDLDGRPGPASAHAGVVLEGRPDAVAAQVRNLAAVGVEHLVLEFLAHDPAEHDRQITAFARDVIPAV